MSSRVRLWRPRSTIWWVRRQPGWRPSGRRHSPTAMEEAMVEDEEPSNRYIVVKALEDGVVTMGLTRGKDTRSHHSERLDSGEALVAQFTELTAAIKVRGKAGRKALGADHDYAHLVAGGFGDGGGGGGVERPLEVGAVDD